MSDIPLMSDEQIIGAMIEGARAEVIRQGREPDAMDLDRALAAEMLPLLRAIESARDAQWRERIQALAAEVVELSDANASAAFVTREQRGRIQALEAERDDAIAARDEAHDAPWPEWTTQCLSMIRAVSGYDGLDDADAGVDLPDELAELIGEFHRAQEARDAALAEVQALRAVLDGSIRHDYQGLCPDDQQPTARDPECPACKVLGAARTDRQPVGGWAMSADRIPPHWYVVDRDGLATLCRDEADAVQVAAECNRLYPRNAPHRAVLMAVAAEVVNVGGNRLAPTQE